MVVTASYGIGSNATLTTAEVAGYSVNPSVLIDGTTKVVISYSEMGETRTAEIPVTVTHKLASIAVTTNPTKVTYEYGDTLSTTGMVITATYSDNTTAAVTGSVSPTALNTVGTQTITVTYTENGVTKTTTFTVTVNRKSVIQPTWKTNLSYTGSSQSVNTADKWNNFDTNAMSIGGTTSGTNAGTYTATFTLGSNYRWADGTTAALNVDWVINKVAPTFSLDKTTVAINAGAKTQTVTITTNSDGTISYSPTSVTGLTISRSGKVITITGDGSTKVASTTITVSIAAGTNWTAPANKTFTVSAAYWEWGSETATSGDVGNATWWQGLQVWVKTASDTDLATCVGKTKYVTLSSAVRSVTGHLVRCIGYNRDGNKTLTFQTDTCFLEATEANNYFCTSSEYSTFGSKALWTDGTNDSQARRQCKAYYNAFPGKAYIKPVQKRYLSTQSNNVHNTACDKTYEETVFLPSENEMGWKGTGSASGSVGYGSANNEVCTANSGVEPYQYYTDNAKRVKKAQGTHSQNGNNWYYWERSRYYYTNTPTYVCIVSTDGAANYTNYNGNGGLAPAFVIG